MQLQGIVLLSIYAFKEYEGRQLSNVHLYASISESFAECYKCYECYIFLLRVQLSSILGGQSSIQQSR